MDHDAEEKGKDAEQRNINISNASSTQQPHHSVAPPSSSSSTEPELVQESKKLKQEDDKNATPSSPRSPRAPVSSITPASHRPPSRPPLTTATTISCPIGSAQHPIPYSNPAQFLLHEPDERARARFRLERQRAKKATADWNGNGPITTQTRPGPSPLRPGPDPYERVMEVVSDVKVHLNKLKAAKRASKKALYWSSSSDSDSDSEPCTVEQVIKNLEKYLKGIPRTLSVQELEDKLVEFQIKVDVDPPPTWYALMKKSTMAFWDNLTDYFVVDALESSDLEDDIVEDDDDDDAIDKGVGGSSSSGS